MSHSYHETNHAAANIAPSSLHVDFWTTGEKTFWWTAVKSLKCCFRHLILLFSELENL